MVRVTAKNNKDKEKKTPDFNSKGRRCGKRKVKTWGVALLAKSGWEEAMEISKIFSG